jgi:hypothetical protein
MLPGRARSHMKIVGQASKPVRPGCLRTDLESGPHRSARKLCGRVSRPVRRACFRTDLESGPHRSLLVGLGTDYEQGLGDIPEGSAR